jgi:hypothetical protein
MDELSLIIEKYKEIGESIQKSVDVFNKSMQPFTDAVVQIQEYSKQLAKIFDRTIYVTPEVYQFLLDLNVQLSSNEIEKELEEGTLTEMDVYSVYTRDPITTETPSFKVRSAMAKSIKKIIENKPQRITMETDKISFTDGSSPFIIINGTKVGLKTGTRRYDICKYIFKGNKVREMPWEVEDLVEAIGADFYDAGKDWNSIMYGYFRRLNGAIKKKTGYPKFFIVHNRRFLINHQYIFLLEK